MAATFAPFRSLKFSLTLALLLAGAGIAPTQPAQEFSQIHDRLHAEFVSQTVAGPSDPAEGNPADTSKAGKVLATVESFADFLLKYFIALAAVGALAMALIELYKKMTDWRTRRYAKAITEWIKSDPAAYVQLLHLTTGLEREKAAGVAKSLLDKGGSLPFGLGSAYLPQDALFALELDQMMGHVQDAVDVALSNPGEFEALYLFATQGAAGKDVRDWMPLATEPPKDIMSPVESKLRADIYTRLHQVVKRKLDALQLTIGRRWVNENQFWANVVGGAVMFGCLWWLDSSGAWQQSGISMTVLSLLGGVLSPVAKDVVIALKKVRGG